MGKVHRKATRCKKSNYFWGSSNYRRNLFSSREILFFPRVRTPCGHGAQVIVEGREEQTDGGERNEGPKTNPKPNTQARRPKLHHLVVFPPHVAISGPEFAKEKDCSASCVHGKPPRRLQRDFPYQVLVTSGQKQGHFAGQVSRNAPAVVAVRPTECAKI